MSEPQQVDEGRRQRYLATLGIPLWTTRHDLPGARPAHPLTFAAFLVDEVTVHEAAPVMVPEPLAAGEAVVMAEPLPDAVPTALTKPDVPTARVKAVTTDAGFPRFSCRVQPLAPGWMGVIVLDEVPDLSAQEHRLLDNLAQALGGDMAMAGAREHFHWPMSPNPAIARDAGAAREALAAFLGRRRESARWLVLGETLGIYVRAALPQQQVIAAPALHELLENPAAKRALWQALHG